jgi:acetyl-CoA acetyltransferase family protein
VDGAAAVVVTREKTARERGLKAIGRLVSWAATGVDPSIMGIGPVPSSEKALKAAGLTVGQMDRVEVNEAFAAQYLAVEKALGLNRDKTNVNGGAIALGHPLGASGTRLVITLLNELRRGNLRYGLATACIGGRTGHRDDRRKYRPRIIANRTRFAKPREEFGTLLFRPGAGHCGNPASLTRKSHGH